MNIFHHVPRAQARTLARLVRIASVGALAFASVTYAYELVVNGGFEQNGGAGSAALTGWTSASLPGSQGGFVAQTGNRGPVTKFDVSVPPQGSFAAMNDQPGPGTHVLYQDVAIPAGASSVALSARLYVRNAGEQWHTPNTLDFATMPNQQVRVDIVSTGAAPTDIGAGVLRNLYRTQTSDPRVSSGYVTITSDLSAYAGQTIRLRFAAVDNRQSLMFGVDAVRIVVPGTLASSLSLTATPSPSLLASPVTLQATINTSSAVAATGGVNFLADSVVISGCSNVVPVSNVASCVTSSLALGARSLRADFAGDANYAASTTTIVHNVITTPSAPSNVVADPRNGALAISFSPPTSNGGAAITGYTVSCTPVGGGSAVTANGALSPITVLGLTNGIAHQCSVVANNAAGSGPSASAPNATPAAVSQVTISTPQGPITVTIVPAGSNCGVTVVEPLSLASLPPSPVNSTHAFPYGLLRFQITGCTPGATIPVDIAYPSAVPASAQYWKYGRTQASAVALWYQFPFTLVNGNTIRISLTDGGAGDDDRVADGNIIDPSGLAVANVAQVVPTMGNSLYVLLSGLLLVVVAGLQLRAAIRR